jgi:protein arginine kinase activator
MLCEGCGREEARHHFLTFRDNRVVEIHLCSECGKHREAGAIPDDSTAAEDDGIQNILEVLVQVNREQDESLYDLTCDVCSTSFREVLRDHLLGCPHCYDVFAHLLFKDKTFQDARKGERDRVSSPSDMSSLQHELGEAVRLEFFERAAELRDKLRHYEDNGPHP